ncbi:MAG TPA: 30S ribosomal protein S16 [Actinomycetota bacterium]|nr:30S ribosomal protein S16 [Actinomycetota bacterium]
MVKIRLMRVGKRKQPSYRVVVADSRSPRDGRIIEAIGHYHPRQEPSLVSIDEDRALYWLQQGAQPSDQVRQLLRISGAWSAFTGEPPLAGATTTPPDAAAATAKAKATPASSVRKATPAASVEARDEGLESDTPSIESTPTEDEQLSETGGASGEPAEGDDDSE